MNLNELKMLQSLPLEVKIEKSKNRIKEFVTHFGKDGVYVSFSGGKDSTVLLHLVRSVYPDIVAVFSNTGLEFPELVKFVKKKENVVIIRPEKNFKQVLEQHGYPVISKMNSRYINDVKNPRPNNQNTRKLRFNEYMINKDGSFSKKKNAMSIPKKYRYMVEAPFKISNVCCDNFKKKPFKKYEKENNKRPIIGTMANESKMRQDVYLKRGCNTFDERTGSCTPMGFWTEQDVYEYILKYNLEIPSVYGDIVKDQNGKYMTTGEKRTGCVFCLYGIGMEKGENRLQRLERTHPKIHDYCINKLGLKEVCEYMGIQYSKEPLDKKSPMRLLAERNKKEWLDHEKEKIDYYTRKIEKEGGCDACSCCGQCNSNQLN